MRRNLTRRDALGVGAAALAAALRPASALGSAPFELGLDGELARATAAAAGWRTTRPLRAPRRFDLVGLRWASGSLEAEIRARTARGRWTPWVRLADAGDHAPDGRRPPRGTDPAWTGGADLLQVRARGAAAGVHARFVRAVPAATTARRLGDRLRGRRAVVAQVPAAPPAIIPRAAWGADTVPPRSAPRYGSVQLAFVHHTVTAIDYAPHDSPAIVLGIARYHRNSNGWNDVGYNFLVDKYGQVFEGRAGGADQPIVGAQAQGWNTVSTGIASLGDFSVLAQTNEGLDTLARLIAWKLTLHGVPVTGQITLTSTGGGTNRWRAGTPVTFERIAGHRDGNSTSCPGDALYAQLAELRVRAAAYAGGYASAGTRLTIVPAVRSVRWPAGTTVSGDLAFPDGAPVQGAPVRVEFRPSGGAWQPLASAACDGAGHWAAAVSLPRSGSVRAHFGGDTAHAAFASAPVAVTVLPALAVAVGRRRVVPGRSVRARGTVGPKPADGRVTVLLERRRRGRYVRVQRKRIVVRGGRFETRLRLRREGAYRLTVATEGAAVQRRLSARRDAGTGGTPA